MATTDWISQAVSQLQQHADNYPDQAFYAVLEKMMIEQQKRIDQAQGEIDGRSWSSW